MSKSTAIPLITGGNTPRKALLREKARQGVNKFFCTKIGGDNLKMRHALALDNTIFTVFSSIIDLHNT